MRAGGNLPTLILARILQGIGGGAMVPIAQAVLLESFPPAKRGVAMATFSHGRGGRADPRPDARRLDHGQLFLALDFLHQPAGRHPRGAHGEWLVEDPPYIKRNEKAAIDFIGFGLLAVWLATLQITLDKGQEEDWFGSDWIRWFAVISAASLIGFIVREFRVEHPLVDLRIFKNRNFAVGVLLMTVARRRFFTAPRRNCRCFCRR